MKKKFQTRIIIANSAHQPHTVLRCVLFAMFLTAVAFAVVSTFGNMAVLKQARAAANYPNTANVDVALRYVGRNGGNACLDAHIPGAYPGYYDYVEGGQCRGFVGCVVWMASDHKVDIGGGYYNAYSNAGGYHVVTNSSNRSDASQAAKGDVIQLNIPGNLEGFKNGMHTAFIVARNSNGTFDLVDSNFNLDLMVRFHKSWDAYGWASSHGLVVNIWRFGTVPPPPPVLSSKTVGEARRPDGTMDIFVRGLDGAPYHLWLDANGNILHNYESLGGQVQGAVTGSWTADSTHLDVFGVGADGAIYRDRYQSATGTFSGWTLVPGGGTAG